MTGKKGQIGFPGSKGEKGAQGLPGKVGKTTKTLHFHSAGFRCALQNEEKEEMAKRNGGKYNIASTIKYFTSTATSDSYASQA